MILRIPRIRFEISVGILEKNYEDFAGSLNQEDSEWISGSLKDWIIQLNTK